MRKKGTTKTKPAQIRISGGELRGRVIRVSGSTQLRPTTDRNREAIFSTLFAMKDFSGARVLDLFAGTGALGIEALSRGASSAVFVESNSRTCKDLQKNLEELGLAEQTQVRCQAVEKFLETQENGEFSLVVVDPPYNTYQAEELFNSILSSGLLASSAIVVIEGRSEMENVDVSKVASIADAQGLRLEQSKVVSQGETCLIYSSFVVV